jgi:hypothetical protein
MDFFKQTPHYNRSCNNELCKGSSDPDDLRNELRGMTGIEYEVLKSEGGISVIQERYREGPSKTRSTKVFYVMDDVTFSQASKNEDLVNCDTGETLTEKEWVVKLRERLRGSKGGAGGSGGGGGGGGGGTTAHLTATTYYNSRIFVVVARWTARWGRIREIQALVWEAACSAARNK